VWGDLCSSRLFLFFFYMERILCGLGLYMVQSFHPSIVPVSYSMKSESTLSRSPSSRVKNKYMTPGTSPRTRKFISSRLPEPGFCHRRRCQPIEIASRGAPGQCLRFLFFSISEIFVIRSPCDNYCFPLPSEHERHETSIDIQK
jgi:hypothetical protein